MSVEATKSEAPSSFCSWGKDIGIWTCRRWCWWIKGVKTSQFTIVIQWDRPQQEHREGAQDRKSPQLSAHPTFWGCEGLWRWFGGQLRWFIIIGDKQSRVWPKKGKNFVLQRGMMGELYKPGIMKNKSKNIELTTLRLQIMLTKLATFGPFSTGGNVETLHKCQIVKYPWKTASMFFPFLQIISSLNYELVQKVNFVNKFNFFVFWCWKAISQDKKIWCVSVFHILFSKIQH